MLIALAIGAVVLLPSLVYLFTLVLRGRFDEGAEREVEPAPPAPAASSRLAEKLVVAAVGGFAIGAGLIVIVDSSWALIAGVTTLLGSVGLGFVSLATLVATADAEAPGSD